MVEAMAAVSFVSAVAGLIDISCRVVNRLNGFHSATQEVPDAFRHIKAQVPIAIDSLRRTQADALAGGVDLETQNALKPTMEGCKSVIQRMDKILGKILPVETDSFWKKTTKVIRSLRQEREIEIAAAGAAPLLSRSNST